MKICGWPDGQPQQLQGVGFRFTNSFSIVRIDASALRCSCEPRGAAAKAMKASVRSSASASGRFVRLKPPRIADLRAKRREWPLCRMMNSATCSPETLHTKYLFPHDSISKTWFERIRALHGSFRCALSTDFGTGYMIWAFAHASRFLRTLLLFQLMSAQQEGPVFLHFLLSVSEVKINQCACY